jgi:uncharacterized membrane protein
MRIAVAALATGAAVGLFSLALARFATFHNETFDLAFYTRMAWGMPRGSFWEPIVGAHILGVHVSPVVVPLGVLGMPFGGTAEILLAAQAAALAAAAWPFARIGMRRLGELGALLGALLWLLFPNLGHVGSFEMHPGTVAVLPLAWAIDAYDEGHAKRFALAVFGVLLCREDLALATGILGLLAWREKPAPLGRVGLGAAIASFLVIGVFLLVLHPIFAPARGSVFLHFGKWGGSVPSTLLAIVTRPGDVLAHLAEPARATYVLRLLAPLAFLPVLAPRLLLPIVPIVGMNLMSEWPSTIELDSHYQTTTLPFLVAAALLGAERLSKRVPRGLVAGVSIAVVGVGHGLAGGTPLARDFDRASFVDDVRASAARKIVAAIPEDASVQAPYALMPHLAERDRIGPAPPPDRNADFVVLDAWHRVRHAHSEDVLRTSEEPTVRDWLARRDYGLVRASGSYLLFARGADTRARIGRRYLLGRADPARGQPLSACLALRRAVRRGDDLVLDLVARDACPSDLAVRIGTGHRPRRVDLLFDGLLSPALLERGDHLRSVHALTAEEWALAEGKPLRVGLLRQSGARPEHEDPIAIDVALP